MADRARLYQLGQVVRLRKAQTAAATNALRVTQGEHAAAQSAHDAEAIEYSAAGATWNRLLGQQKPDPSLVGLSAFWLLERQRLLKAEELNLSIADGRLLQRREEHALALAREAASTKITAQNQKTMAKYREERQSMQQTDAALWRWQR